MTTNTDATPAGAAQGSATRKQIRGSSLLLSGRFISLAVNFVVQILIVRYLTKADFGAFAYALSLVAFGQTMITVGLDNAITRFVPIYEERGELGKVCGTLLLVTGTILSLALALIALVFGLKGLIAGAISDSDVATTLVVILVFLIPIQAIDAMQTGMFAVFSKPRAIFVRKYLVAPGFRLAVVLLVVLGGKSVVWLAAGTVIAGFAGVALYGWLLWGELAKRGLLAHFRLGTMSVPVREIFTFTVPMLSTNVLYTVMNTSDVVLLGHFGGATDVGAFRVIGPAAQLNTLVLSSFGMLFTPLAARLFARADHRGVNDVYWGTAIWTAVLSFPIFAVTFSLADPLTSTLYGERYADSAAYLSLLALGYYFQASLGFNGLTLKVYGLLRYIVSINLIAMVANLALNLALIPVFGPLGAAIGTCGTLVVHNFFKQWGLRRAGIDLVQPRSARVYASIVIGAGLLLTIQVATDLPFAAGVALAAVVSLVVVLVNRHLLQVAQTFPELLRFRPVRRLLGPEGGGR